MKIDKIYHFFIFSQNKIISWERYAENNRRDPLETVNPFFPLWSLPAYVEHFKTKRFVGEVDFNYSCSLNAGSKHVILSRHVVFQR